MFERNLCGNCGQWREAHYNRDGSFRGERLQPPCGTYYGIEPSEERLEQRNDELKELRSELRL